MVALFGGVGLFVVVALGDRRRPVLARHRSAMPREHRISADRGARAARRADAAAPARHRRDCTSAEEERTPWRRWFHHCTFYGFLLCFASTSVAALYHSVFGWLAPYAVHEPARGARHRRRRRPAGRAGRALSCCGAGAIRRSAIPAQRGLDESFIVLLFLTSVTGLAAAGAARQRGDGAAARRAPRASCSRCS